MQTVPSTRTVIVAFCAAEASPESCSLTHAICVDAGSNSLYVPLPRMNCRVCRFCRVGAASDLQFAARAAGLSGLLAVALHNPTVMPLNVRKTQALLIAQVRHSSRLRNTGFAKPFNGTKAARQANFATTKNPRTASHQKTSERVPREHCLSTILHIAEQAMCAPDPVHPFRAGLQLAGNCTEYQVLI